MILQEQEDLDSLQRAIGGLLERFVTLLWDILGFGFNWTKNWIGEDAARTLSYMIILSMMIGLLIIMNGKRRK